MAQLNQYSARLTHGYILSVPSFKSITPGGTFLGGKKEGEIAQMVGRQFIISLQQRWRHYL